MNFARMSLSRVYLFSGISSLVMLVPAIVSVAIKTGTLGWEFNYLAAGVIFVMLWLLARYEQSPQEKWGTERAQE